MKKKQLKTYNEVLIAIASEKIEQTKLKAELKLCTNDFIDSFNPLTIVKKTLTNISTDDTLKTKIAKAGMTTGANLIIDLVLGKRKSVKGFLSSILLETVSNAIINSNSSSTIMQGLRQVLARDISIDEDNKITLVK